MPALNIYKNSKNPNNDWVNSFVNPMSAYPDGLAPPTNILVAFVLNTDLLKTVRYGWTISLMGVTTDMPVLPAIVEPTNDKAGTRLHFVQMVDKWQAINSYKGIPLSTLQVWKSLQVAQNLSKLGLWQ